MDRFGTILIAALLGVGIGSGCKPAGRRSAMSEENADRWYAAGHIDNRSDSDVTYWKDGKFFSVPPHSKTGMLNDVDHVEEPSTGRWCKIGGFKTAVVKANGFLQKCPTCWTEEAGKPCPKSSHDNDESE